MANEKHLKRHALWLRRVKLTPDRLNTLFSLKHPAFDPNLFPSNFGPMYGGYYLVLVTLWQEDKAKTKKIELGLPRFPWFYDLNMKTNIQIATRYYPRITPHDSEINWIALNLCDFHRMPDWDFFFTVVRSLRLWSDYTRDIVIEKRDKAKTSEEAKAVKVKNVLSNTANS